MSGYTLGVPEDPGKEIARRRTALGLSPEQLGAMSGVTGRTITRIEQGETTPQPGTLKGIWDALGEASGERPRPDQGTGRAKQIRSKSEGTRVEDHLGDLIYYIGTLKGKRKTEFIRAVITLLAALEHTSAGSGTDPAPNDGS